MYDEINRGDIFYVSIPYATGHEMEKDRPGIIVSCNELNRTSPCVAVVMCTGSEKRDLPEHITIRSTPIQSTALCEHIYTVDKSRIGKFVGRCTRAEMASLDIGLMAGLSLGAYGLASRKEEGEKAGPEHRELAPSPRDQPDAEFVRTQAERDIYEELYKYLLDGMNMERRARV